MNLPIRARPPGCKCDGSGLLGADRKLRCLCQEESMDDELARVTAERNQLAIANAELAKVVADLQWDRDAAVSQLARELELRRGAEDAAERAISRAASAAEVERGLIRVRISRRMASYASAQDWAGAKALEALWNELGEVGGG